MAGASNIEWTEMTWNPFVGCAIVSPGCTNCYAMSMAARIEAMGNQPRYDGTTRKVNGNAIWTGKINRAPRETLLAPLRRKKPAVWFVNSMSDCFAEGVPDEWIDEVFAVMALTPRHSFQVLTKRSQRMRDYFAVPNRRARIWIAGCRIVEYAKLDQLMGVQEDVFSLPLSNVWLGVSTERQKEANERIPHLLETPAAIRFISAEPLLSPINLNAIESIPDGSSLGWRRGGQPAASSRIDWVIVGAESGPGARPMDVAWAEHLRDQCNDAGVAFFMKQLSGPHGRAVKDIECFPLGLQVREMPEVRA